MAGTCVANIPSLRARLGALGMTQTALAETCDVELRTLQRWLAGGRLRIEDAERVACALGVGTSLVFDGVSDGDTSFITQLRAAIRLVGTRGGSMSGAIRASIEHFDFLERTVSFHAHPRSGYVHVETVTEHEQHAFLALRVAPVRHAPLRIALSTQVGRAFRYEFGEVIVDTREVFAIEHFHTRSSRAERAADGSFEIWIWTPPEMRKLVTVSTDDVRITRAPGARVDLFDLADARTRHAVCSRPAPMHLRAAKLGPVFDRVVGPRDGRIDVVVPESLRTDD